VGDGGAAGRAAVEESQEDIVGDGGAAAVDDDAGAVEVKNMSIGEGVARRPGIEGPAANGGVGRERHIVLVGRAEEGGAGRHRIRRPVGSIVEIAVGGGVFQVASSAAAGSAAAISAENATSPARNAAIREAHVDGGIDLR